MQKSQNKYCILNLKEDSSIIQIGPQKYFYLNVKNYLEHIFNLSIHEI